MKYLRPVLLFIVLFILAAIAATMLSNQQTKLTGEILFNSTTEVLTEIKERNKKMKNIDSINIFIKSLPQESKELALGLMNEDYQVKIKGLLFYFNEAELEKDILRISLETAIPEIAQVENIETIQTISIYRDGKIIYPVERDAIEID